MTPVATCPRYRALLAANSYAYALKLARDRPLGRYLSSPPPAAPVTPCMATNPEPPRLAGAADELSAAHARPRESPLDRHGGVAAPAAPAVASGTLRHTRTGSSLPSPPARIASGTPNTFESCRTAGAKTSCCSKKTRHPSTKWIIKAPRPSALDDDLRCGTPDHESADWWITRRTPLTPRGEMCSSEAR